MKKIILLSSILFGLFEALKMEYHPSNCALTKKELMLFSECRPLFLNAEQVRTRSQRQTKLHHSGSSKLDLIEALKNVFNLSLIKSPVKTTSNFLFLNSTLNESEILGGFEPANCVFYGKSKKRSAVINMCNGLSGYFLNGTDIFLLRSNELSTAVELLTIRPDSGFSNFLKSVLPLMSYKPKEQRKVNLDSIESRNDDGNPPGKLYYIEMAVFVDRYLKENLENVFSKGIDEAIASLITAMVGSVNVFLSHPSLGSRLEIVLKRIEILSPFDAISDNPDVKTCLEKFCKWQEKRGEKLDDSYRWDHALLLTGLDLESITTDGKKSKKIVGLAPISGMCESSSSCSVIEGNSFESVFSIAHELGHNLGMNHDGYEGSNTCDPGAFIMSPTLDGNKNTWSSCSKESLGIFLRSESSDCLSDLSPSVSALKTREALPGEKFSADLQCQLRYGPSSRHSTHQELSDICRDLHCLKDHFTWTSHPAIEGTTCGTSHWCRNGVCTLKNFQEVTTKNQATAKMMPIEKVFTWSDWSPCKGSCVLNRNGSLSFGVRSSTRQCNKGQTYFVESEECQGFTLRFQTCISNNVCPNLVQLENLVDSICNEESRGLSNNGKLTPDSCDIFCVGDKNKKFKLGAHLPDGIECSYTNDKKICIRGKCEEFKCSEDSQFLLKSNVCSPKEDFSWSSWRPSSPCLSSCLLPSHGIRFVQRFCVDRNCPGVGRSIQICNDENHEKKCSHQVSTTKFASEYCSKLKSPNLSGFGGQLKPTPEDPDRPCKIACQDSGIKNRFYITGIFPTTTRCGQDGICVRGLCLELDSDGTLKYHTNFIKKEFGHFWSFDTKRRRRESVFESPRRIYGSIEDSFLSKIIKDLNETSLNYDGNADFTNFVKMPIDIDPVLENGLFRSKSVTRRTPTILWILPIISLLQNKFHRQ